MSAARALLNIVRCKSWLKNLGELGLEALADSIAVKVGTWFVNRKDQFGLLEIESDPRGEYSGRSDALSTLVLRVMKKPDQIYLVAICAGSFSESEISKWRVFYKSMLEEKL